MLPVNSQMKKTEVGFWNVFINISRRKTILEVGLHVWFIFYLHLYTAETRLKGKWSGTLSGPVTRGNFCRQLGGNQLQCACSMTILVAHESCLKHYLTIHKRKMITLTQECLFFLEIAWNWLPLNCLLWHGP